MSYILSIRLWGYIVGIYGMYRMVITKIYKQQYKDNHNEKETFFECMCRIHSDTLYWKKRTDYGLLNFVRKYYNSVWYSVFNYLYGLFVIVVGVFLIVYGQ